MFSLSISGKQYQSCESSQAFQINLPHSDHFYGRQGGNTHLRSVVSSWHVTALFEVKLRFKSIFKWVITVNLITGKWTWINHHVRWIDRSESKNWTEWVSEWQLCLKETGTLSWSAHISLLEVCKPSMVSVTENWYGTVKCFKSVF